MKEAVGEQTWTRKISVWGPTVEAVVPLNLVPHVRATGHNLKVNGYEVLAGSGQ